MWSKIRFAFLVPIFVLAFSLHAFAMPDKGPSMPAGSVSSSTTVNVNTGGTVNAGQAAAGQAIENKTAAGQTVEGNADESMDSEINIKDIIRDKYIESTDQFLVTITRPGRDENTFKKTYVICGVTDKPDIQVALAVYNEAAGVYVDFVTTDGASSWDAGSLFAKEIVLSEGANRIKIVAYKKSEVDNPQLNANVQVNYFTVTVLKESLKDKILNDILKITEIFEKIIPNK